MNLNIKISFELYKQVCNICEQLNISVEQFIQRAIQNEINRCKNKVV